MKAAVTCEGGRFECVALPDPTPAPDQLVLRVTACGLCGSDLSAHRYLPLGTVMGHEMCGEVVAVGKESRDWREGAYVAVLPLVSCGACARCAAGDVAHCASGRAIGMGSDKGGFAEYAAVPARHAFRLPDAYANALGALVEPLAVGLHSAKAADLGPGQQVLVVGAGGVGLTVLTWARALGVERITIAEPLPARRATALAIGATDGLASADEAEFGGYDAVIECVGRPDLLDACVKAVRPLGRIVIAGATGMPMQFTPIVALKKEASIRFAVAYRPSEFEYVIDALADGRIDPHPLVGPALGLDRVGDAFEMMRTGIMTGRVLITPGVA